MCWGTFDVLHKGHENFLKDAKEQGDYLIVIVISDESVYLNKKRYPINSQEKRIEALKKLKIIDKIIRGTDIDSNFELIKKIAPSIFVFGYDQKTEIEQKLRDYFNSHRISCKFHYSKKFGKIHSSHLRK